jgi:hypothetical protein
LKLNWSANIKAAMGKAKKSRDTVSSIGTCWRQVCEILFMLFQTISLRARNKSNVALLALAVAGVDFWDKPELQKRLEAREILVSVKEIDAASTLSGVGRVSENSEIIFKKISDPLFIAKSSTQLKNFVWDQKSGEWAANVEVLFFTHQMKGRAFVREPKKIEFFLDEGFSVRCQGVLEVREILRKSEIIIRGQTLESEKLSWVKSLAAEVLLHKIAAELRASIETKN